MGFAYAQLALSMSVVGANVTIGKLLLGVFPLLLLCTLRHVIACAVLIPWAAASGSLRRPQNGALRIIFLQAFFGIFLFNLFLLAGVGRTSAIDAGILTSTLPAVAAIAAWRFLGERPGARIIGAIALAVLGLGVVNAAGAVEQTGGSSLLGNMLVFAAVIAEALYTIFAKRLAGRATPLEGTIWANLFGLLLFAPLTIFEAMRFAWLEVPVAAWAWLFAYALGASVLSFLLWYRGIARVPASTAGIFTGLVPVAAIVSAILLLGERPSGAHAIGFALLTASLLLATRSEPQHAQS